MLLDTGVSILRLAGATLHRVQTENHSTVSKDWENKPKVRGKLMTQPVLNMQVSHQFIMLVKEGVAEDSGAGSCIQEAK